VRAGPETPAHPSARVAIRLYDPLRQRQDASSRGSMPENLLFLRGIRETRPSMIVLQRKRPAPSAVEEWPPPEKGSVLSARRATRCSAGLKRRPAPSAADGSASA